MKQKLTSVKIDEDLFDKFKIESYKVKLTFGKFVHNTIYLFLTDPEFRDKIRNLKH